MTCMASIFFCVRPAWRLDLVKMFGAGLRPAPVSPNRALQARERFSRIRQVKLKALVWVEGL